MGKMASIGIVLFNEYFRGAWDGAHFWQGGCLDILLSLYDTFMKSHNWKKFPDLCGGWKKFVQLLLSWDRPVGFPGGLCTSFDVDAL